MAKTAVKEEQEFQTEDGREVPYATGYNAAGEAVDQPVDTREAQTGLPGVAEDRELEMFDGRQVTAWKYSLTGNMQVSRTNAASRSLFEAMRAETPVTLLVTVVPGSVRYAPNTEDGHVVGFTRERKLHVTDVWPADADASELFEGGLMRVRAVDDGIGFMTTAPDAIPDDDNPLAASLAEAMPIEPGMCGEIHSGHKNACRQPAHACPLRGG